MSSAHPSLFLKALVTITWLYDLNRNKLDFRQPFSFSLYKLNTMFTKRCCCSFRHQQIGTLSPKCSTTPLGFFSGNCSYSVIWNLVQSPSSSLSLSILFIHWEGKRQSSISDATTESMEYRNAQRILPISSTNKW